MSSSKTNSSTSQTQIQETDDNRIAGSAGSTNLVLSRSNIGGGVNVTTTDFDSVSKAFDFAGASSANAMSMLGGTVSKAFDFARLLETGAADERAASAAQGTKLALTAMDSVKSAYADSTSSIKDAYKDTSDTLAAAYVTSKAGEQKVMVAVGLVVVGIVAIKVMGKA